MNKVLDSIPNKNKNNHLKLQAYWEELLQWHPLSLWWRALGICGLILCLEFRGLNIKMELLFFSAPTHIFLKIESHWLSWKSLCRLGWPWTQRSTCLCTPALTLQCWASPASFFSKCICKSLVYLFSACCVHIGLCSFHLTGFSWPGL